MIRIGGDQKNRPIYRKKKMAKKVEEVRRHEGEGEKGRNRDSIGGDRGGSSRVILTTLKEPSKVWKAAEAKSPPGEL